jgi:uncharacterized membrane protein
MSWLIVGLLVFLVPHSVGLVAPQWRSQQVARLGEKPWKGLYSLVSLAGLVLIIWGYGHARATPVDVWAPPAWGRHAAAVLTVIGFVLIAAAYVPRTKIKAALGHPMTAGVALWAFAHLLANGTLRDVVLFGAFLVWALVTFVIRRGRDARAGTTYPPGSLAKDAIAVVAGVVVAVGFALFLHGPLIGVRPFG